MASATDSTGAALIKITGQMGNSAVTTRNKLQNAARLLHLAHALAGLVFLPLVVMMGPEIGSTDRLRHVNAATFGTLLEFLQTGEDGWDGDELWRSNPQEAVLRCAARLAAKHVLPAIMAAVVIRIDGMALDGIRTKGPLTIKVISHDEWKVSPNPSFVGIDPGNVLDLLLLRPDSPARTS
ncbi:hypothetical protein V8E36_004389 [Tilletia maclaganii]